MRPSAPWFCTLLTAGAVWCGQATQDTPPAPVTTTQPTTTRPSAIGSTPTPFQPGVAIDWQRREVHITTHVVLQAGQLEFFACFGGKEHESILRFDASATHIYIAMGLIGLLPGHPPEWDPSSRRYAPPTGDLIDIAVEWQVDQRTMRADAYDWLYEVEYGRPPLPRPWVFAGSRARRDGTLSADHSGVGIALVDFPDSLVCYSRRFPSRYGELWAAVNATAVPPVGTEVKLVLRPAVARPMSVRLDHRGAAWVNGRVCTAADLVDLLQHARRLNPGYVQPIDASRALRSDQATLRRMLLDGGITDDAFRFRRPAPTSSTGSPPPPR